MYMGTYTEEEFRSLGIMATFVSDEMFDYLDRSFFMDNMDFLQTLCYSTTKMDMVARILQEPATFGYISTQVFSWGCEIIWINVVLLFRPVRMWTKATLSQVNRFLFFLPRDKLQEIPLVSFLVHHFYFNFLATVAYSEEYRLLHDTRMLQPPHFSPRCHITVASCFSPCVLFINQVLCLYNAVGKCSSNAACAHRSWWQWPV